MSVMARDYPTVMGILLIGRLTLVEAFRGCFCAVADPRTA